jgi:hypothetical protein
MFIYSGGKTMAKILHVRQKISKDTIGIISPAFVSDEYAFKGFYQGEYFTQLVVY